MEAQSALVRANGTVELHPVADVYMHLSLVVCPRHAKCDHPFRFHKTLDEFGFLKFGMSVVYVLN